MVKKLYLVGENQPNKVPTFAKSTSKRSLFIENIGKKYDNAKKA